jgi:hypothetical protein
MKIFQVIGRQRKGQITVDIQETYPANKWLGDTLYLRISADIDKGVFFDLETAKKIRDEISEIIAAKEFTPAVPRAETRTLILSRAEVEISKDTYDFLSKCYNEDEKEQEDEFYSVEDIDINDFLPVGIKSADDNWDI